MMMRVEVDDIVYVKADGNYCDLVLINATQNTSVFARDAYGVANSYPMEAKAMDRGTAITGGDVSVSAEVTLEYRFR